MAGYAFVVSRPRQEYNLYAKLRRIKGIMEIHPVFGEYDFVVKYGQDDVVGALSRIPDAIYIKSMKIVEEGN